MNSLLSRINLKTRLILIVMISISGLLFLGTINLYLEQKQLRSEKEIQTRHVVETAHGVINFFYKQVQAGVMTNIEARKMAMNAVKQLNYNEKDYFWINDRQPKMIMHPFKPELDGKDLSSVKDPTGKYLFNEMVKVVKNNGSGYITYLWPKPGMDKDKPVEKLSYVKGFTPWQWIIGSGIYIDDIDNMFYQHLWQMLMWVLLISFVMIVLSFLIGISITPPLDTMQKTFQNVEHTGDLTLTLPVEGKSEFTKIAKAFNSMLLHYADAIREVDNSVEQLEQTSVNLKKVVSKTTSGIQRQQNSITSANDAINEMLGSVNQVTDEIENSASSATQANKSVTKGQEMVSATMNSIKSLATSLDSTTQVSHKLEEDSNNIGSIVDVIKGIAEQTNLLALNAAIEAARAGEQGRGFAVVADEVRNLAQKTQESTAEIESMIESIQKGSDEAVKSMTQSHEMAQNSVKLSVDTAETLTEISTIVNQINDINSNIRTMSQHQQAITDSLTQHLQTVNLESKNNSEIIEETNQEMDKLNKLAPYLDQLMKEFKHN